MTKCKFSYLMTFTAALWLAAAPASSQIEEAEELAIKAEIPFERSTATVREVRPVLFRVESGATSVVSSWGGVRTGIKFKQFVDESDLRPNHYESDEDVYVEAERILRKFNPEADYVRKTISWGSPVTSVGRNQMLPTVRCVFDRVEQGYAASNDFASVSFRLSSGRPVNVELVSGWNYERPNIRITPEQAISITVEAKGGTAGDWRTKLAWFPIKPELGRYPTTMRLTYSVYATEKGMMHVDTVSGAATWVGRPSGSLGPKSGAGPNLAPPEKGQRLAPKEKLPHEPTPGSGARTVAAICGVTFLVFVGHLIVRRLRR